jgi:hypothetical protein
MCTVICMHIVRARTWLLKTSVRVLLLFTAIVYAATIALSFNKRSVAASVQVPVSSNSMPQRKTCADLPPDLMQGASIDQYIAQVKNVFAQHGTSLSQVDQISYLSLRRKVRTIVRLPCKSTVINHCLTLLLMVNAVKAQETCLHLALMSFR